KSATSRPRREGGAISEMYIGATTDEIPTPTPPMNRKIKNIPQPVARPEPSADTRYSTATMSRLILRPYLSAGTPPYRAPMTVPMRAMETVSPCSKGLEFQSTCRVCSAPEITAVSKPKRKPPRAAEMDQRKIFPALLMKERFRG